MKVFDSNGKVLAELNASSRAIKDNRHLVENTNLKMKDLKKALLKNIIFSLVDMDEAQLSGCSIRSVLFEGGGLSDADLTKAVIENAEFYDVEAYGVKFIRAQLYNVQFLGVNLSSADFTKSKLRNVIFGKDNIGHKTSLNGAILSQVELSEVHFKGVTYDEQTCFPEGFNPATHDGLVKDPA